MPAIAPIVLGDGTSNVHTGWSGTASGAVTFVPSYMNSAGVMTWYHLDTGDSVDARDALSISVRQPSKGSQVARVTAKVVVPVMDEDDSSLKVGEGIATIEIVIPKRMAEADRVKLWAYVVNFFGGTGTTDQPNVQADQNDYVNQAIIDLASPY
jgi:hypothetical protein